MRTFVLAFPLLALATPAWAGKLVFVPEGDEIVIDVDRFGPTVWTFLARRDIEKPAPDAKVVLLPKIVEAASKEPF